MEPAQELNTPTVSSEFSEIQKLTYLRSASMSPIGLSAYKALCQSYFDFYSQGEETFEHDFSERSRFLKSYAKSLGVNETTLNIVSNASFAMNALAFSMRKQYGNSDIEFLSFAEEFPGNIIAFKNQGFQPVFLKTPFCEESFRAAVNEKTQFLVVSHIQFSNGYKAPIHKLAELAREYNLKFIVNTTQSFPFYRSELKGIEYDYLVCALHKWHFTGHAGALIYVAEKNSPRLVNPVPGWLSVQSTSGLVPATNVDLKFKPGPECLDTGTSNLRLFKALNVNMNLIEKMGTESILNHLRRLSATARKELEGLNLELSCNSFPEHSRTNIISFQHTQPDELADFLGERRVFVDVRHGMLRISLNLFNTEDDILKLAQGISDYGK